MLESFDQADLRLNPNFIMVRETRQTYCIPSYFAARLVVDAFINDLVCASTKFFVEPFEAALGRGLRYLGLILVFLLRLATFFITIVVLFLFVLRLFILDA